MNRIEGDLSRSRHQGPESHIPSHEPPRHPGVIALEAVQRWMQPAIAPNGTDYTRSTIAETLGMDPTSTNPLDTIAIDTTMENLKAALSLVPAIQDGSIDITTLTPEQRQGYTTALNLAVAVELQAAQEDRTFDALADAAVAYKTADLTEDEVIDLQREVADAQEKIHIDNLTGLSNEAGQNRWLETVLDSETSQLIKIYGIDGDGVNLKRFNNLFGMDVGDAILRHIAKDLKTIAGRRSDILVNYARLHGDEFAVLIAGVSTKDLTGMVEKFQEQQLAKDNSAFFNRINTILKTVGTLDTEIKKEIVDGEETEFLYVNGENMGLISNLAVIGIGVSGMPITSIESLHASRKIAEKNMARHKDELYEKNGKKYRTA